MPMTMSPAICALICFTALTIALALGYVGYRIFLVLSFKTSANSWTRDAEAWQDPPVIVRIHHAHLNSLENLPLYAAVVLAAYATGQIAVIDSLAMVYLGLRVAQSLVHVISTTPAFVFVRANLWVAQIALLAYWLLKLCGTV